MSLGAAQIKIGSLFQCQCAYVYWPGARHEQLQSGATPEPSWHLHLQLRVGQYYEYAASVLYLLDVELEAVLVGWKLEAGSWKLELPTACRASL